MKKIQLIPSEPCTHFNVKLSLDKIRHVDSYQHVPSFTGTRTHWRTSKSLTFSIDNCRGANVVDHTHLSYAKIIDTLKCHSVLAIGYCKHIGWILTQITITYTNKSFLWRGTVDSYRYSSGVSIFHIIKNHSSSGFYMFYTNWFFYEKE